MRHSSRQTICHKRPLGGAESEPCEGSGSLPEQVRELREDRERTGRHLSAHDALRKGAKGLMEGSITLCMSPVCTLTRPRVLHSRPTATYSCALGALSGSMPCPRWRIQTLFEKWSHCHPVSDNRFVSKKDSVRQTGTE